MKPTADEVKEILGRYSERVKIEESDGGVDISGGVIYTTQLKALQERWPLIYFHTDRLRVM